MKCLFLITSRNRLSASTPSSRLSVYSILIVLLVACLPEVVHAIEFPKIPGVTGTEDPVTIIIKVAALILKAVVYIIFAASFAVAAYVAITTLLKMIKDRDNAGDLVGKLMASVVVVVLCYWFLAEGEKASDALKDVKITAIVMTSVSPA